MRRFSRAVGREEQGFGRFSCEFTPRCTLEGSHHAVRASEGRGTCPPVMATRLRRQQAKATLSGAV